MRTWAEAFQVEKIFILLVNNSALVPSESQMIMHSLPLAFVTFFNGEVNEVLEFL